MSEELPIIIDAHCHIFPEKIAQKATQSIGAFYGINMDGIGSPAHLNREIEGLGIKTCVVCSTATKPEQTRPINDFLCAAQKENPELYYAFGTLHQDMDTGEALAEIDRIVSMGLHGIKLHPDFQRFPIDLPGMMPVYRYIAKRGLPILFHTGDNRYDFSSPARLYKLAKEVPDLMCIAAHLGGYSQWEEAQSLAGLDNVWFDCSSSLEMLTPEFARKQIYRLGVDRVFFGSDFPMWKPGDVITLLKGLHLTEDVQEAIFHVNFERQIIKKR